MSYPGGRAAGLPSSVRYESLEPGRAEWAIQSAIAERRCLRSLATNLRPLGGGRVG